MVGWGLSMNRKKNSKSIIYKSLFTLFFVIFIGASSILISDWYREKKHQDKFEELSGYVEEQKESEPEEEKNTTVVDTESATEAEVDVLAERGIVVPEKNLNWNALYEENEHIIGWIYIPGTKIDYPILQHPEIESYYLNRNLDGSVGYPGCIYIQLLNNKDFTDYNTVLYGHNMKNKTMFATLHKYEDITFLEQNHYAYIYTPETTLVYDLFAAYEYSDKHILYEYNFDVAEARQMYLDMVFGIRDMSANIRRDVEVTSETPIITMITCISGKDNKRYFVNGALVNTSALKEIKGVQE